MAENDRDDSRSFELKRASNDSGGEKSPDRDALGSSSVAEFDSLPPRLRRKYYVVEIDAAETRIYADRGGEYLVAKAGRDRLVTQVASVEIVRDLVAIAAHRGWERIELTGSLEFRREAWLAASVRGIEAKGYEPTQLDRAALAKMRGDFDHSDKTVAVTRDRTSAGPQAPHRASGPTVRDWKGGTDDQNARSHLAVIERVVLAAFPKDPAARKRVLDAAREGMTHHRRRGARFDRAEIVEGKTKLSREPPSKSAERTRDADRAERGHRTR
ncbi:MAG: hypothetical protein FD139_2539 [Methylocystaceae bacterium]|nr:MAG: hypothetical protein FD148_434 [Methylocystaceae bacterium]KAF0207986.1 MAG: hypothetical protein FD172_3564 [Methylocystaceae bacterium]TXT44073.1 MAG: hypothetical protein FD139_2539 [Methylocystaceae bacterium]